MDDFGASESIGAILMVFILVAFVGIMFGFVMGFGTDSQMSGYTVPNMQLWMRKRYLHSQRRTPGMQIR